MPQYSNTAWCPISEGAFLVAHSSMYSAPPEGPGAGGRQHASVELPTTWPDEDGTKGGKVLAATPSRSFLSDLVQKNMARILAFHGLMPAQAQQLTVPPMRPDDDPQPITEQMPIFPPEDGGAGVEQHAYAPQVLLPPARPEDDPIGGGSRQAVRPEDLIVACGERVRGLARKLACGDDRLDADDLYSTGMLEICEAVAAGRLAGANDPVAYLCGVARYGMLREYRQLRGWSSISMDAPLTDDGSLTLHDILPAPSTPVPARRSRKEKSKKRLVNDALGHVTARQRAALRRRFGLVGYGKHTLNEAARSLHVPVHSVSNATHEALRALRVDYRLCKAMGVEVQV